MFRDRCKRFTLAILVAGLYSAGAWAADWPNWRGPNHDGISAEKGLQTKWAEAPPLVWERTIGSAFSGLTCVGDHVYTCGTQEGQQVLFCLHADTGEIVWQRPLEEAYRERQGGDGTRSTPVVDEGRVYVQGARGKLICCDAQTGAEHWSRQFNAMPQWGYSGSVLIEDDLAIAIAGDDDGPLVALDKKSGRIIWKHGQIPVGYSSPYPFTLEGRRYVVAFLGKSLIIVDIKAGREVWSTPWETSYDVNAATPIFHDGHLFFSSGYKHGCRVVKLQRAGEKLEGETVWESQAIRAKFQSPVLYEGHLYTSDEVGLKCVEFATGQVKWGRRGVTSGTVVIADGNLFLLAETGKLFIGKASPSEFAETTDVQILNGRCWTVPTLYRGRLYARDFDRLVCLNLKP
ncbi:MAG: PQQ-binding-like beta-propeller repeat protein [Planctomycetota bacterium]